jgi:hypothetical protein
LLHTVRFIAFVLHWTVHSLSACRELVIVVVAVVLVVVVAAGIKGLFAAAEDMAVEEAERRRMDATLEIHGPVTVVADEVVVVVVVAEATTVVEITDLPM